MEETTVTTGSRQFLRNYRHFKKIAAKGGKVSITDREDGGFIFMKVVDRQHPPRQAATGLDAAHFAGIDLDEPALPPRDWTANS